MLRAGEIPPMEFTRPEVAKVLIEDHVDPSVIHHAELVSLAVWGWRRSPVKRFTSIHHAEFVSWNLRPLVGAAVD